MVSGRYWYTHVHIALVTTAKGRKEPKYTDLQMDKENVTCKHTGNIIQS